MEKAYRVEGYTLQKYIGEGVYSLVFLAEEISTGEIYAIKAVHKGKGRRRGTQHAETEIAAFSKLTGIKGVPVLYKWIEDENTFFFIMSYHKGPTADEICKVLSTKEILLFAASLLEIVNEIHKRGVYHLDIKPENVILSRDGPILVDFGCAITSTTAEIEKNKLPFQGTPAYMAPEMVKEEKTAAIVLPALDIWSVGCIIYYVAAGREAFSSITPHGLYTKILECNIDLSQVNHSIKRICKNIFILQPKRRAKINDLLEMIKEELHKW